MHSALICFLVYLFPDVMAPLLSSSTESRDEASGAKVFNKEAKWAPDFAQARSELSALNKERNEIQQDKSISPQEKRKQMDEIDRERIEMVKELLDDYYAYDDEMMIRN